MISIRTLMQWICYNLLHKKTSINEVLLINDFEFTLKAQQNTYKIKE